MCGIAGILRWRREAFPDVNLTAVVQGMTATMRHRGPDADGVWTDPVGRCVLGHRRLSIIDTSDAGRQPMATGDGRWLITFNGEIYNFAELRPTLDAAGVQLRGRTDTEVLIEAVAQWGRNVLPKLDGMFAFAAFDTVSGELLLARDPFGEKPLYYMEVDGALVFASELQALERVPGFDGTVSLDAMAEVIAFQYIGAPRSIYRAVKKLPPANWLRASATGQIETGRYFEFRPGNSGFSEQPLPDLVDELEEILTRSVRRRLIADVPLGAFLSGGVDSSTACALVRRKLQLPLKTFSVGFDNAPESEHLVARKFAKHLETEHYDDLLTPDVAGFLTDIGKVLDEPNADSSCLPTYLLSRFARQHVTVAISGDGGDEMFGGYGRYFHTLDEADSFRAGKLPDWKPGGVYFGDRILVTNDSHLRELFGRMPDGYAGHVRRLREQLDESGTLLLSAMRHSDTDNYMPGAVLPKVDRMSMQHSLEVRTPYLNMELARFAERLPDANLVCGHRGKIILRELAYRYLPKELIDLPKQGFGLPMSDWARPSMLEVGHRLLEGDDSRIKQALGGDAISRFMARQRTPGQFSIYQVWALAMLESWCHHHPAKLPQIDQIAGFQKSTSKPEHLLQIIKLAEAKFLVASASDEEDLDVDIVTVLEFLSLDRESHKLGIGALDHEAISSLLGAGRAFPAWGEPVTAEDMRTLSDLRGSTVLFVEPDALREFGYGEYQKFRYLGVRSVVFRTNDSNSSLYQIDFRTRSRIGRAIDLARLFARRIAIISNSKLLMLVRAKRFAKSSSTGDYYITGLIRKIIPFPDVELASSYMLFEGRRQLPPVPTAHHDIASKRNGRYSVWNQYVMFSPTSEGCIGKPYWLVPLTDDAAPLLPMNPSLLKLAINEDEVELHKLKAFISRDVDKKFAIKPGDRLVVCTHALPPGGAERQWVYLAQALADFGYDVQFVTYQALEGHNSHYLSWLRSSGIPHTDLSILPLRDQLRYLPRQCETPILLQSGFVGRGAQLVRLSAAFRMLSPKVVFAQLDESNILSGFAAHFAEVPRIVMSFRNYNPSHFPYIYNDWFLPAYQLLATSERVLFSGNHRGANQDYAEWIGIAPERIACIHNAIDPAAFPEPTPTQLARARAELGLDEHAPVILGVFRLSEEKDPLTFVEVCGRTRKRIPNLRALIVGVGPMRNKMELRVAELDLKECVQFLERRADVNVLMGISSLLLLTSLKEGMPNVVLEAQSLGKPVVATDVGAVSEIVADGQSGVLCIAKDVDGLTEACSALLSNPEKAQRLGNVGRLRVAAKFEKHKLAQHYIDLVNGVGVRRHLESLAT